VGGGFLRKPKKAPVWRRYALIVLFALILPLLANALRASAELGLGERAASFGAVLNMPGEGLRILLEDLRAFVYPQGVAEAAIPLLPVMQAPVQEPPPPPEEGGTPLNPLMPQDRPRVPPQYKGEILHQDFGGTQGGNIMAAGSGLLRNYTKHTAEDILEILKTPVEWNFESGGEPLVLIYHTHATESFERFDSDVYDTRNTWRSTDNNNNMVAVGAAMAAALEARGVPVIHDTTQHDNPSYNSSYARSAETVSAYLEEYPSIKIVLDLHRDAMERENNVILKPVSEIEGEKAAQIMIISGCDDGTMNMPGWRGNLRLAAAFQNAMADSHPGLTRPILFTYRKYNQHLSPGALLVEFGSNANTLDEAIYSARLAGDVLADLILSGASATDL
jgi:stage II sporulation protein P